MARIEAGPAGSRSTPQTSSAEAIRAAERLCLERGARLTFMRRAVFETLCAAGQPLGAYQIMDRLSRSLGKYPGPPTVYRALEFLLRHGLVARIESRNAFVPHVAPGREQAGVFFICEQCGDAAELAGGAVSGLLRRDADALGFEIGRQVVELQGTCAHCRDERGGAHGRDERGGDEDGAPDATQAVRPIAETAAAGLLRKAQRYRAP